MAIGFRAAAGLAGFADTATPFANQNYTLPTGHASGDLLLAISAVKWSTSGTFSASQTTPSTYSLVEWVSNGTTVTGNGTGSIWTQVAQKTHSGTESAPAQTFSAGYSPAMLAMIALSKASGSVWNVTATDATDTNTASPITGTGAATLDYTTGDWVVVISAHNDDVTAESAPSITISGCTVGTITERLATNSTVTGNDGSLWVYTAEITAGTATGAPVFSATTAATEGDGAIIFLRVREEAPPPVTSVESWGFLSIS